MKLDRLIDGITPRLIFLVISVSLPILALVGRLWYEQLRLGEAHRSAISSQSIRKVRIGAVRGRILDRDGIKLADVTPSYDILFHVHEMRQAGRGSRIRTLEHVINQIHRVELQTGRPSDVALEWAATPPEVANNNPPIPNNKRIIKIADVLNWHGVVVRSNRDGTKWGWSPFNNDKTKMAIDLEANTFHCADTAARGGPVDFVGYKYPSMDHEQLVPIIAERMHLLKHVRHRPSRPYEAFTGLTAEQVARVEGRFPGIKGMEVASRFKRAYTQGESGAHLLGSTGRIRSRDKRIAADEQRSYAVNVLGHSPDITPEDLKAEKLGTKVFFKPELAGQSGLEYRLDKTLRGEPGSQFIRVNSVGYLHSESGLELKPRHGADVHLTVSARAQAIAQRLLGDQRGALVTLDCNSGAVLSMVSAPSYDPKDYQKDYNKLIKKENGTPLFNRALRADYFPGSIVKPLILAMALERGITDPTVPLVCPKYYQLGRRKIGCSHYHEPVNAVDALKHSCNTYFIDLGIKMGPEAMPDFLRAAGFGRDLEFELAPPPGLRRHGLCPDPIAYKEHTDHNWTAHETANASIGQGYFQCSPLQAAVMTAAIANGGRVWRPYVVSDIRSGDGTMLQATPRKVHANLPISPKNLKVIHEGMAAVVWGAQGTGSNARSNVFPLAGKTGTAEVGSRNSGRKHTWFVGYGPVGAPTHAIVVMIEDGVSGGKSAAPIAKQFFEEYFADDAVGQANTVRR